MKDFDRIRLGVIGYGVGKTYSAVFRMVGLYYPQLPGVDLVAVATSSDASGQEAVTKMGFERYTTDYRQLLESDDINAVVIATPNYLHHEMLTAALRTDKAILTDKPLARTLAEARDIQSTAQSAGSNAQMMFQFRYCPAVMYAHQLIEDGRLGRIYAFRFHHFRPSYVNPEKPLGWNARFDLSGGGVLPSYLTHSIDLLIWMLGLPTRLTAQTHTYIGERPARANSPERVVVDTEDHAIILADLPDEVMGTVEGGRLVVGAVNELGFEVMGSHGSLKWDAMNPNYLYLADKELTPGAGRWVEVPTVQKYADAYLPGSDMTVGMLRFYVENVADFVRRTIRGEEYDPDINQGVRVQAVVEAALNSAGNDNAWVEVDV